MPRRSPETWRRPAATTGSAGRASNKSLRRFEELGEEGLRDGSSAPMNSPNTTKPDVVSCIKPDVVSCIVDLRSHYRFGPHRLSEGVVPDDTGLFNDKLQECEDFYNFSRPHRDYGGQTLTND